MGIWSGNSRCNVCDYFDYNSYHYHNAQKKGGGGMKNGGEKNFFFFEKISGVFGGGVCLFVFLFFLNDLFTSVGY